MLTWDPKLWPTIFTKKLTTNSWVWTFQCSCDSNNIFRNSGLAPGLKVCLKNTKFSWPISIVTVTANHWLMVLMKANQVLKVSVVFTHWLIAAVCFHCEQKLTCCLGLIVSVPIVESYPLIFFRTTHIFGKKRTNDCGSRISTGPPLMYPGCESDLFEWTTSFECWGVNYYKRSFLDGLWLDASSYHQTCNEYFVHFATATTSQIPISHE